MKYSLTHQEKVSIKPIGFGLLLILSIFFSLICFESTSPFSACDGNDSVIFKSMGLAIIEGKTPYVDYFDHKGPILYFFNALGQWLIPGNTGLFLMEILGTFFVFCCLFKTAKYFCQSNYWMVWLVLIISVVIYGQTAAGGNTCEEWELIGIASAFCAACSFLLDSPISKHINFAASTFRFGILLGACFSFCFFIRPNDAVSQVGGLSTGALLLLLYRKDYRKTGPFIGGWLAGALGISLPILLFFASRTALSDLYYGLIGHNLLYAGNFFSSLFLKKKIILLLFFIACSCMLWQKKKKNEVLILLTPVFLLSYLLHGERFYEHYYTIYIPLITVVLSGVLSEKNLWKSAFCLLVLFVFINKSIGGLSSMIWQTRLKLNPVKRARNELLHSSFKEEGRKLFMNIPVEDRDSIWNFNLSFNRFAYTGIFWKNGIMQMNRIPFYEMAFVDPKLAESDNIEKKKPLWITLTHENDNLREAARKDVGRLFDYFQPGYDYIEANYDRMARTDTTICDIELWRRRDMTNNTTTLKESL